jgi:ribosomal peptide maturation radical SAM protein 1
MSSDGQTPLTTSSKQIALISMPTLMTRFPSFQLGLLKSTLAREDISVQPYSMYLYFGAHIGWQLNDALSIVRPCMAAEWLWAKAAFGEFADDDAYLRHYALNFEQICSAAGCTLDDIIAVRDRKTFSFIDFCLNRIDWERFDLIGFSVVFQQMVASLALARALKERHPHIPIILGGATFEDDIGDSIIRGCPWVDYVHCGDADQTFPDMIHRLRRYESLHGLPGVMWRDGAEICFHGRAPNLADLNTTPIPNFDEYFYARRESGYSAYEKAQAPMLPIETARGCWWGMKHHCTFCGLNRAGMEFRAKRVDAVLEMLETLSRRYGVLHFDAIDNIVATEYIDDLFGQLAKSNTDIKIHYEVRPYLSREQLGNMKRGGLFSVQPGIESLSTHVLKLMKKFSTGINNLAFIKWCTYFSINNLYFILTGFAGETIEDYQEQYRVISKIPHLQPPVGIAPARADRGSPMYTQPEAHGVARLVPSRCYQYIYPPNDFDLSRVSYFFDHDQGDILNRVDYEALYALVGAWKQRWQQRPLPSLRYFKAWKSIRIEDARYGTVRKTTYTDRAAQLYEFCNDARNFQSIVEAFDHDTIWVENTLGHFVEQDLIIHLDDRYLSLALPANAQL